MIHGPLSLILSNTTTRRKLATAKHARTHNDVMVAVLEEKGIPVPEAKSYFTELD